MKILICTGIYPPAIGGPAEYAKNLVGEFLRRGIKVRILTYGLERKLPIGIRHILYFFRVISNISGVDLIITLDTFSVGLPAVLAAKIFKKKIIIRTGGDFLWESYIEKTGQLIKLKDFNNEFPGLSFKQKMIFKFSEFVLNNSSAVVFSTQWQRNIFERVYKLNSKKSFIVENFYGEKLEGFEPKEKKFVFAGRILKLKNLELLKDVFEEINKINKDIKLEIITGLSHDELLNKIKKCYAVILPSLSEISPNFILDAIRVNKPFILTRETGFYERLKDIGVFVDPLDKEAIKNEVLFLTDNKNYEEYKRRIANFKFTHSWSEIADEFLNIYRKSLND